MTKPQPPKPTRTPRHAPVRPIWAPGTQSGRGVDPATLPAGRPGSLRVVAPLTVPSPLPDGEPWLLPVAEVARRLSVSDQTVYRLLDDGVLIDRRVRGRRLVVVQSVREWLAQSDAPS